MNLRFVAVTLLALPFVMSAQAGKKGIPMDIPGLNVPKEPKDLKPAATDFYDKQYKLHFHVPAGWNFARKDGELSTFAADTRDAKANLEVRGVAAMNYNPYPPSTFAGALMYYSVLKHTTQQECAGVATSGNLKPLGTTQIAGVTFQHGRDEHGASCIESRNDVFTTMRGSACVRFDLVVNTFCAASSGAMEIQPNQLGDIQARLAGILGSVRFDAK